MIERPRPTSRLSGPERRALQVRVEIDDAEPDEDIVARLTTDGLAVLGVVRRNDEVFIAVAPDADDAARESVKRSAEKGKRNG